MSWVVWITGLPGSGKSTVAQELKGRVPDAVILRMDELRTVVTPEPTYSDAERECVYRALVFMAKLLHELGHNVIIDATGNRRSWRGLARSMIPDFFEVYLRCPIEICMRREQERVDTHDAPRQIYKKGQQGWPVPGVKVPYEEPEHAEVVIDTERVSPSEASEEILKVIGRR